MPSLCNSSEKDSAGSTSEREGFERWSIGKGEDCGVNVEEA